MIGENIDVFQRVDEMAMDDLEIVDVPLFRFDQFSNRRDSRWIAADRNRRFGVADERRRS